MRSTREIRNRRRIPTVGAVVVFELVFTLACTARAAIAQQPEAPGPWEVSVGAGVASTAVYPGARERYLVPFPAIEASYGRGPLSVSASVLNGLGVTYFQASTGLLWSASVAPGAERRRDGYRVFGVRVDHSDHTAGLLLNTDDVSTPVSVTGMVALPTPVGLVGATVGYHPTKVRPLDPARSDQVHHGMQYALLYLVGFPLSERLAVTGTVRSDYMNRDYARAWYSVEPDTPPLRPFEARSGFRATQVAAQLEYSLTSRIDLSLLGAASWLLGDARRSPLTQVRRSHDLVFQVLYRL